MTTDFNKTELKTLLNIRRGDGNLHEVYRELMKYKEYLEGDNGCNCLYCTGQRNFIEYFLGLWDGKS